MKSETLDLNKMQELLNGLNDGQTDITYDSDVYIDTDRRTTDHNDSISNLFSKLKIQNDPTDINVDFNDLNMALNVPGKVGGYANITNIEDFYDDITLNIPSDDLANATYIVCIYFINPNISMFNISDVMEKLYDSFSDVEMIFGTYTTEDLKVNEIGYRILITGIQDDKMEQLSKDDSLDLRYHKQLVNENHQLKNKVDELLNKINRLEIQKDRLEVSLLRLNKR